MMRTIRLLQDTLAMADKCRWPDDHTYLREISAKAVEGLVRGLATAAAPAPAEAACDIPAPDHCSCAMCASVNSIEGD